MEKKICKDCGEELTMFNMAMCVKCSDPLCENCAISNKFKCKECNPTQKSIIDLEYIRRSHIEDYKDCPYYFYLQTVKGEEVPPNIYAKIGIDLHDLYDMHQKGEITLSDIRSKTVESILSCRGKWDDELVDKMEEKANKCNEAYESMHDKLPGELVITEETIFTKIKDGLPLVRITMDMIRKDSEGNLHIYDYKTGKTMVGKHLATNMQVPLYIHAVQDKYGIPVKSFTLLYLSEGKERVYNHIGGDKYVCNVKKRTYTVSIDQTIKEVQSIFGKIKGGRFNPPERPNFFKCKMCHFKEIGKCQQADTQRWINANGKEEDFVWNTKN